MSFANLVEAADRAVQAAVGGDEVITYTPDGGPASAPIDGIYSEAYVLAKGSAQAGVEATTPAVFFRLAALPNDPRDDQDATVTIDGVAFRVLEREPDGMGGIVLGLRRRT